MSNPFDTVVIRHHDICDHDIYRQFQYPYPEKAVKSEKPLTRKEWKKRQEKKKRHFLSRKRG